MTGLLRARVGGATVLAGTGQRRLWLLDPVGIALWDLQSAGFGASQIAGVLAQRFGITPDDAQHLLDQHSESWLAAGLTGLEASADADGPLQPLPEFAPPCPPPSGTDGLWLRIADRHVLVQTEDLNLRTVLEPLLAPARVCDFSPRPEALADQVCLSGDATHWKLTINGVRADKGGGRGAALVSILSALTELGARAGERLLVVHGAGLTAPDGRCLLIIAPGGGGKSTLAVSLEAGGFRLMSDDVVPIRSDGAALGLGLPSCIKPGSRQVLATVRPDLDHAMDVARLGKTVRYLPAVMPPPADAVIPSFLLFPRYQPGSAAGFAPLPPEMALQRLIDAGAVIRDLTQEKLEMVCGWVAAIPAYALTYPDLTSGKSLVEGIVNDLAARPR